MRWPIKWFKHDTDMHTDLKVQALVSKYGAEGYAVWCLCLEFVGKEGKRGRIDFKLTPFQGIAKVLSITGEGRIENIASYMAELKLICPKAYKYGHLYIPKFLKRADDYTARTLRTNSERYSDNVHLEQIRIDKNRIDKILHTFKDLYIQKVNTPYIVNYGRDCRIIRDLLLVLGDDELLALIQRFFASTDPFIQKAGYTIGVFKSMINKLRTVDKQVKYE